LQHRESPAAEVARHVHREQAEVLRRARVPLPRIVGDPAAVLLGVHLPRHQFLVDEPAGAVAELDIVRRESVVRHGLGGYVPGDYSF